MVAAIDSAQRRLRWQCRRGLLELDWLLERFLDRDYPTLSAAERQAFEQLLSYPDPQLQWWLLEGGRAEAPETLRGVIELCLQA